jgi:hypothetical protein
MLLSFIFLFTSIFRVRKIIRPTTYLDLGRHFFHVLLRSGRDRITKTEMVNNFLKSVERLHLGV